jgi:hypothetical protein
VCVLTPSGALREEPQVRKLGETIRLGPGDASLGRHPGPRADRPRPFQLVSALWATGIAGCVPSRDTRREQNEKVFRMGNERLSDAVEEHKKVPETAKVPFLCECADEFCDGRVELERTQWKSIASNPNEFLMLPGHLRSEGEVVVGEFDGYEIVRKPD